MNKIIVLGAGMVGKAIAYDLSKKYEVTVVDMDSNALEICKTKCKVNTINHKISNNRDIQDIVTDFDLVISAVPGHLGLETLKNIIEAKKNVVDISFMPEDFMVLDDLAKKNGVIAITDSGVAPGMPNIILGHHSEGMKINNFEYLVGGLPKERKFPFEYKAPFSPIDVIEEYMRPARAKFNNQIISSQAMSDPEMVYFKGVGHLEAFNTDGLRSLLTSFPAIPNMKEKTLRYPGHIKLIKALKEAGFFNHETIMIDAYEIKPIDFTNKILFNNWKLKPFEEEFTVMRIIMEGIHEGHQKRITYDMYSEYDKTSDMSSMARTTGYTATAMANVIINGLYKNKGVNPPEWVGKNEAAYNYIIQYLSERGIEYNSKTEKI